MTSIDNRQRTPPTNPNAFLFGGSSSVSYADFSQALNPVNSYGQGSDAGSYTARAGETLQSIAANLWGDSSLWYKLAQANGLSGPGAPGEGRTLAIPANVMSNAHNASTFSPYDPAKAIGDLSPTNPKPAKKAGGCGVVGQIIATIIAVVVSYLIPIPVVGPVLGNLASQAFLIAIGQQSKINWKSVGVTAIASFITPPGTGNILVDAAQAAVANAATQGIAIATGLQKKFSWTGVATAGITAGVASAASQVLPGHATFLKDGSVKTPATFFNQVGTTAVASFAAAASRSLIQGTDFGDNLIAELPTVLSQTIGNLYGEVLAGPGGKEPQSKEEALAVLDKKSSAEGALANATTYGGQMVSFAGPPTAMAISGSVPLKILLEAASAGSQQVSADDIEELAGNFRLSDDTMAFLNATAQEEAEEPTIVVTAPRGWRQRNARQLGSLSERFETGGRGPGTINHGRNDRGGPSYGLYQLATNFGQPQRFLQSDGRRWLPEFQGARPGTPTFDRVWREIAAREPQAFSEAQHAYIERTHYDPAVADVLARTGLDLNGRSGAVRDAAWSTSVQHGTAASLLRSAVRATDRLVSDRSSANYDEVLINKIYDARTALANRLAANPRISRGDRTTYLNLVRIRYRQERRAALSLWRAGH